MYSKQVNYRCGTFCVVFSFFFFLFSYAFAQLPAFPGAEGYGKYVTGGRGGAVYIVTNLNDSGPGSLRYGIQQSGPRTIVFQVSGTIELQSRLDIVNGDLTIAGQTAPGDGICLKNYPLHFEGSITDHINGNTRDYNIIVRYLRFRLGDEKQTEDDAFNGRRGKNIIIDHCSMSWSVDETASFYDNENFTMQWSIISESLYKSVHDKGQHGYGGIWGGQGATFHHNLLAHHTSRNPRFCGSRYTAQPEQERIDHRNNVIYNWGGNSCYGAEGGSYNIVNNYYKSGPATGSADNRIIDPDIDSGNNLNPPGVTGFFYVDGNYVFGYPEITTDNWNGGVQGLSEDDIRTYEPYDVPYVLTQDAEKAFHAVLADAGAVRPKRDPVDARIVEEARTGTATYGASYGEGTGIIDTQTDVGGWPELVTGEVPVDADNDGMADDWETNNGLNPGDADDRNGIAANGYTNLENYLNSLTFRDDYVRAPGDLKSTTLSDSEIMLQWKELSSDETGFSIERSANDTTNFTEIIVVDADDTTYTDSELAEATRYFYRVKAVKNEIKSIASNIVNERTIYSDGRALEPENPYPDNNAENIPVAAVLNWEKSNAAVSYDVYFDTQNPPQAFLGGTSKSYFDPHGLEDSTTYYWRVDAKNDNGTTTGDIWQFTSEPFISQIHAYWDFNRGFGRVVLDESGFSNSALLNNMSSTASWIDGGVVELAMLFEGTDDYLSVDNDPSLNFSIRSFTINFWLKQSVADKIMPWVSKADYENETYAARYEVFSDAEGQVNFLVADTLTSSVLTVNNNAFFSGQWVMFTAVRNSEDQTLKIYLNDQLQDSATDSTYNITNNGDLLIATNAAMLDYFEGQIDELRLYNYALDQSQISDLYAGVSAIEDREYMPRKLELTNYPNPFNSSTLINYSLPQASHVSLEVYNMIGQKVATLIKGKMSAGNYSYRYDAANLSSGLYVFRLQSDNKSVLKKVLLLK